MCGLFASWLIWPRCHVGSLFSKGFTRSTYRFTPSLNPHSLGVSFRSELNRKKTERECFKSIMTMKYFAINFPKFFMWHNKSMCVGGWREKREAGKSTGYLNRRRLIDWLLLNVYALMIFRITQVPFFSPHAEPTLRDVINNHSSGNKSIMQEFICFVSSATAEHFAAYSLSLSHSPPKRFIIENYYFAPAATS